MIKREPLIVNKPPQDDAELVSAIGRMSIAFGRLEDMLKILQARIDGIDPDEFVLRCGQEKLTAHKIVKSLSRSYDPALINQVGDLFKIRNDLLHSTYTSDPDGRYLRLREGETVSDLDHDIDLLNEIALRAGVIIPALAQLLPIQSQSLADIHVRQGDFEQDAPAISKLMDELQAFEKTIRPQRDDWANIETTYMAFLLDAVQKHDGVCFLAEHDSRIVGLLIGWIEPPDEQAMDVDEPPFGYISEGIIARDYRRLGIYQKLVDIMEHYVAERGVSVVRTVATCGNDGVTSFLKKNGFTPYYTCFEKRLS